MSEDRSVSSAFEKLLHPHVAHLFQLAFHFTGSTADAEDLVQDLLVKLYPRRRELADIERLRPWLARVLYRQFIDGKRRVDRSPVRLAADVSDDAGDEEAMDTSADAHPGPEDEWERGWERRRLLRVLDGLSSEHRTILALHDIEGYTLEELTEALDSPLGTLKSRLHRARARLREMLK
jgi:RNA polymerase sigma-70 factor (ECF subfamily)